jgi:hypothetical protein
MIKKRTTLTKSVDEYAGVTAKVYLSARIREEKENSGDYCICVRYFYYTDENDPQTEVDLKKERSLVLSVAEMDSKESTLGSFAGPTFTAKSNDMLLKIVDDHLNTEQPYGTDASGFENVW